MHPNGLGPDFQDQCKKNYLTPFVLISIEPQFLFILAHPDEILNKSFSAFYVKRCQLRIHFTS